MCTQRSYHYVYCHLKSSFSQDYWLCTFLRTDTGDISVSKPWKLIGGEWWCKQIWSLLKMCYIVEICQHWQRNTGEGRTNSDVCAGRMGGCAAASMSQRASTIVLYLNLVRQKICINKKIIGIKCKYLSKHRIMLKMGG